MKPKHLLPLTAVGLLLLTGCGTTGPLPSFNNAIKPEWIRADFDGLPGDEFIATSNLQDVVFNDRGEVIGWYVKLYAGTPFIKKDSTGKYDFTALKAQRSIMNLVGQPSVQGEGAAAFPADRRAFALTGGPLDPAQPAEATAPQLTQSLPQNRQDAVFRYTQGGATVTKTVTLRPRSFKVDVKTTVTGGPERVTMLFPGLAKAANPRVQAVPVGGQPASVQGSGTTTVQNIQYAAIQEVGGTFGPGQNAHALIVRPQAGTNADATLTGGAQSLLSVTLPAASTVEVFGGRNELIHLYQSGYTTLPGLFAPNIFGQISLWIVKLMEAMYKVLPNWGLVLILLTVLLRLVMWPLMQAQGRTTARMQVMQPKIKEVQDKYKDRKDPDSQRAMQQEMQQVYRDYNFNPAGCFSTFVPFPVLIALWSTIRNFEFDSGFLWLPDLAIPDPLYILALIYLIVNIGQLYVMTRKNPAMFRQQAFIYLIFLYFALTFPAGVTIYIIFSTLIGIGQQILINKQVEKETASIGTTVVQKTPMRPAKVAKTIDAPKK
ncbi:membrane protein insertase YidC [Deinococcus puniceus]|uniref:Membrane protein insertase YidC n=1 Tax=Deinococcus puniceus TaxID=1182568 RepID=A0A172T7R9_9DEIO|nr:membrane protein insertase YidC [Deinococcus puniceus]ANE43030.1 membrane protein insertase YidC [Deinococcus puniceus]